MQERNILNLTHGKLTETKPLSIERDDDGNLTITQEYHCYAGEAFGLVPGNKQVHPQFLMAKCTKVSISSDESRGLDVTTVQWTSYSGEDGEPINFDGKEVDVSSSVSEESIFVHPKFKEEVNKLDLDTLAALKAFAGGTLKDEKGTSIKAKLKGKVNDLLLSKILRGQTSWYSLRIECKMTFPTAVSAPPTGKIVTSFSGLPRLPDGHKWLCMGSGKTRKNGRAVTTISFMGGMWDEDIYS
ncbi:MAG: hypothetical protein RR250_07415 [Akkermansia sp.]